MVYDLHLTFCVYCCEDQQQNAQCIHPQAVPAPHGLLHQQTTLPVMAQGARDAMHVQGHMLMWGPVSMRYVSMRPVSMRCRVISRVQGNTVWLKLSDRGGMLLAGTPLWGRTMLQLARVTSCGCSLPATS